MVKSVTLVMEKNAWNFKPDLVELEQGDKVILTVINQDDFDHGIAIDAFGVSQRVPAGGTITAEFVVTQRGDFPFYCSVPCGSGVVAGKERGHFDQYGTLRVSSLVKKTQ